MVKVLTHAVHATSHALLALYPDCVRLIVAYLYYEPLVPCDSPCMDIFECTIPGLPVVSDCTRLI